MKAIVESVVRRYYGCTPLSITKLGGGYYARVYLADIDVSPYKLVVKIYLTNGLVDREKSQLELLKEHSLLKAPTVYLTHRGDEEIENDALVMEYVHGVNAGEQWELSESCRITIGNQIVDNLLHLHAVTNPSGFGEIDGTEFQKDWRDIYRVKAQSIYEKARELKDLNKLDMLVYNTVEKAMERFDDIFYLPITRVTLIHGDYNTWNIMLNEELDKVIAVIDPYDCCWGDGELDIYQLNNANGKYLSLLDKYIEKAGVSENFALKLGFYGLFTEIMHYYDANIDPENDALRALSGELEKQMIAYSIVPE